MITLKLNSYRPIEINILKQQLEPIILHLCEKPITNTRASKECRTCQQKHICEDICKLYDFLIHEKTHGYPHCKKK